MSPITRRHTRIAIGIAAVLATTASLTACGGGSGASSPASQAPASGAPASQPPVGGNPGTWTPLTITAADNGRTISMVPDQVALLEGLPMNDGEDLNVKVTDENVAIFERAETGDKVSAAPAIIAKAPGTTDVVFTYDEQGDTSGANVAFTVRISVAAK